MREAHAGSRPASGAQQICQRHAKLASCVIKRRSWQHRQAGCCAPPTAQSAAAPGKQYDLLALSNLCVDVFVPVDELPSSPIERSMLDQLELSPQWSRAGSSEPSWELGGNFNTMIAAARLGMRVGAIGHIGRDDYGRFCARVLEAEGIQPIEPMMPANIPSAAAMFDRTLVCFVLVDRNGRHAFCSRYDFGPWPLLEGVTQLPEAVKQALSCTHSVYVNGFVFDDLPLELVKQAARVGSEAGAAVCFDPGPRCFTMREGGRRLALDTMLDLSDVVLMTLEEATQVTGCSEAEQAARFILQRPGAKTQWCVIKMGGAGALLMTRTGNGTFKSEALPVEVSDTVGCGDSFAAAIVLGYIRGHSIHSTLLLANAVGAATAMGRGAGRNVASAQQVQQLLRSAEGGGRHPEGHVQGALTILENSLDEADGMMSTQEWADSLGGRRGSGSSSLDSSSSTLVA